MPKRLLHKSICLALVVALLPLASACAALTASTTRTGALVINEVVSSNKHSLIDPDLGSPDWIELYNASDKAISLEGYGLSDNLRNLNKFVFGPVTIAPGAYLVVYAADNNGATRTEAPCTGFGLSKSGDFVYLTDAYYGVADQLEIPALYTDVSYARRSDGTFGYCAAPTPGAPNTGTIESSLQNLFHNQAQEALIISEVMPTDETHGYPWVELHNTGQSALQLENYYLSDSEANVMRWQLPAATIPAGGYLCIWLSGLGGAGESGIHSTFKLSKNDTCVILADLRGTVLDEIRWAQGLSTGIAVVKTEEGGAYTAFPTFEAENSMDTFTELGLQPMEAGDPVHINEVLRHNTLSAIDGDGDRGEWVELVNTSASAMSLYGYFLSDNEADLYKWALPDVQMEAGGYLLVFLSGKNRREGELHASFGLADDETALYLTTINGLKTERIPLDALTRDNISIGRDKSGSLRYFAQPTPGYENAQGFETADSIGCFNPEGVFISEVCAVNEIKSRKNDWIELYNGSAERVDLSGWYLSDSLREPQKWQIESLAIGAGEYAVIETTSHATRQKSGVATFGIGGGGENIVLSDAQGNQVDVFKTGALSEGITSGRLEDDASVERVFFQRATKGEKNSSRFVSGYAPEPAFSEMGLYHTEAFTVRITCRDPNAAVYYTTDGSMPTANSARYAGPVTIGGNTVLRAASVLDGKFHSAVTTATYLFEEPHTVPVVCVNGDPKLVKESLNVSDQLNKIENEALISYYETDGTLGVTFPAGIKVKGAGTVVYAQKSISINLRAGYGQSTVTYPFFPGYEFSTFSALVVRNGGQDWLYARMRDSYCQRLVEGMHIDNSATRPVAVYVNGKYNGLYDLGEDQNKEYLEAHYGVDSDAVDIIRRNSVALSGRNDDFLNLREYAANTRLSDDAKFAEFAGRIDVEFFTDYFIAQTYVCNSDMFNQKYWRSQDNTVKWRPIFYDLDFGFRNSASRDMIGQYFNANGVPSANGSLTYFEIYIGLKKNAAWREYCVRRYVECVVKYFNSERATAILDEMAEALRAEMPRQIRKWGKPGSMSKWESEVASLRKTVANRPEYALENMRKYFGVSKSEIDGLVAQYAAELTAETALQPQPGTPQPADAGQTA